MNPLRALVAEELSQPVDTRVTEVAAAIASLYPSAARAVLFYGSCLREAQLDGLMLDFYLIVSDYDAVYDSWWLSRANELVPPNVFPFAHNGLAAKYAVLSEADFARLTCASASSVSVWARFAQPSRLVWWAGDAARGAAIGAVAEAAPALLSLALPLADGNDPLAPWRAGFAHTYRAELRAEGADRSRSIVDADPDRYVRFGAAVKPEVGMTGRDETLKRWRKLQRHGKFLSVLRLAKASFTFAGGIDYLAWKINRHAGTKIEIKPWQRRWPLVAALVLVPKLILRGAVH